MPEVKCAPPYQGCASHEFRPKHRVTLEIRWEMQEGHSGLLCFNPGCTFEFLRQPSGTTDTQAQAQTIDAESPEWGLAWYMFFKFPGDSAAQSGQRPSGLAHPYLFSVKMGIVSSRQDLGLQPHLLSPGRKLLKSRKHPPGGLWDPRLQHRAVWPDGPSPCQG